MARTAALVEPATDAAPLIPAGASKQILEQALVSNGRSHLIVTLLTVSRIFSTSVSSVYPHYVNKVEKRGRTKDELDEVIMWLTGFNQQQLATYLDDGTTFEQFFADANLNPNVGLITGSVCGVRVEHVEDPLMQKIRYLDKLVDELAKGRPMEKVLRA